jgi:predicted dehydrogenase
MPNIAVVSTAHIHTKSFLENLAKGADGRKAYAIWDDIPERGQRYAEQFGAKFVPKLGKLLVDKAVDGFLICAENTRHWPLLRRVLPVGKPVMCEKPLCTTVHEARKAAAILKKHPTKLICGYFQPFSGTMQAVRKTLEDKALGAVTAARFRNAHHAAYGRWFDNPDLMWFTIPGLSGGGAMMDMGTHAVHLLRTLLGPVTEVWADLRNQTGIYVAVDDFGIAHLKFASGVMGTVEAAWTQTGGIDGLEIVGSAKTLWNAGKGQYVVGGPGEEPAPLAPQAERPTRVDRLIAAIGGQVSDQELADDLAAILDSVLIMSAIYRSSKSGSWEKVKSIHGEPEAPVVMEVPDGKPLGT